MHGEPSHTYIALNVCDRHYRRRLQATAGETAGQFRDCLSVADILDRSNLLENAGPFQDSQNVWGNLEIIRIAKSPATLTQYRPIGLKSPSVTIFLCTGFNYGLNVLNDRLTIALV